MEFSNKNRQEIKKAMTDVQHDVLVIGGGITGAGIALDASTRGMKIALVEMQDFAAGTSSRSTKLVHGGLRYLKQLQVGVVAEVGKERAIVYENGPHVTTPEWMLLPFHKGGTFGRYSTSLGLKVYDFLAGVKRSERRKMLSKDETIERAPLVKKEDLIGGGYYVEYRTDDARLTMETMKEAVKFGALALNYARVEELLYENGKIIGVIVRDLLTDETFNITAKKIVNAAGPWVDDIREKDHSKKGKVLQLSKGVHLVFDQSKFPLKQAVYFDTPDGRMVFAIPREGKTYVGTTDTFYNKEKATPRMTTEDRNYIIKAINYMFPTVGIKDDDVESSWAGVRPLIYQEGKNASEISRKDEIWESQSGLITIAGGKLTGYRKMAENVVDLVAKKFAAEENRQFPGTKTKHLPLSGGHVGGSKGFQTFMANQLKNGIDAGLTEKESNDIVRKYGSNAEILFEIARTKKEEAKDCGLPLGLFSMLVYAIEHEMAVTPLDFFLRRTGFLLFSIDTVRQSKERVIHYMQTVFGWYEEEKARLEEELERELNFAVIPADLQK